MWSLYILIGVISGIFSGLGMGGGTLLVPLVSMLGIQQKQCLAINLVSFTITASVTLIFHFKNGLVKTEDLFRIILPACIFSLIGAGVSIFVPNIILKRSFGAILVIMALGEIVKVVKQAKNSKSHKKSKKNKINF